MNVNFDFRGWGESPLQLFDQQRWAECLHASIQAYNVAGDPQATQLAVMDTGVLHELAHLACGIDTWTHRSLDDLRGMLVWTEGLA